jgi:hypothetical protein
VPPPDRDLAAPVLAVAHRAGNSPSALRAAAALGAHLAEADLHLHRGRLEIRHGHPSSSSGSRPTCSTRPPTPGPS